MTSHGRAHQAAKSVPRRSATMRIRYNSLKSNPNFSEWLTKRFRNETSGDNCPNKKVQAAREQFASNHIGFCCCIHEKCIRRTNKPTEHTEHTKSMFYLSYKHVSLEWLNGNGNPNSMETSAATKESQPHIMRPITRTGKMHSICFAPKFSGKKNFSFFPNWN